MLVRAIDKEGGGDLGGGGGGTMSRAVREPDADVPASTRTVYDHGRMATVLKWNGRDLPDELRKLPEGRYVIESLDAAPALTPEEEQGLEEALAALDRGEGTDLDDVRADLDAIIRR